MTIIAGTIVDWTVSPRIITFPIAENSANVTDIQDTLLDLEDSEEGIVFKHLREMSGGEDLGGGVSVGFTMELQNAQLSFAARVTPLETGTITTPGTTTLIDSTATFQTNLVGRGDLVINVTDSSQCTVISVDSEIQLTTTALTGGVGNDFGSSDAYDVYDVEQCNVDGGNVVAVDSGGSPIDSVFPTFGTQIVRTSASSATTQELADIQFSSFNGGVTVKLIGGTSGTVFPTGTERQPVDNFTDAISIAVTRGFLKIFVIGDATVDSSNDFTNYSLIGQGQNLTTLTLDTDATFINTSFFDATVTGILDGDTHIEGCTITNLTFVSGVIENCLLSTGTITLGGSLTAHLINCASGVVGASTPIIDMGGSGQELALRNYNGGIQIDNKTGTDKVSIDMNSGQVILDSTVTATVNDIIIRGIGKLTNNAVNPELVVNELLDSKKLNEIYTRLGLQLGNAITDTTAGIDSADGDIDINRTGDGETTSTLTRQ